MELKDNIASLLSHVDHTLLSVTGTKEDYIQLCSEGLQFKVASVCVPPSRVQFCADYTKNALAICTVVGFPNGYTTDEDKAFEAQNAIKNGAAEIDMVANISMIKEQNYTAVLKDIQTVREATHNVILKVIIETALLTDEEKINMCAVVSESGADYIKTSTGFASGGATFADIELMKKHAAPHLKIKAAGGIATFDDAFRFIELGADRLGTSRIVKLVQGLEGSGY